MICTLCWPIGHSACAHLHGFFERAPEWLLPAWGMEATKRPALRPEQAKRRRHVRHRPMRSVAAAATTTAAATAAAAAATATATAAPAASEAVAAAAAAAAAARELVLLTMVLRAMVTMRASEPGVHLRWFREGIRPTVESASATPKSKRLQHVKRYSYLSRAHARTHSPKGMVATKRVVVDGKNSW